VVLAGSALVLTLAIAKEVSSPLPLPTTVVWGLVSACAVLLVRVWDLWLPVSDAARDLAEGRLLRSALPADDFSIVRLRCAPHGQRVIVIQARHRDPAGEAHQVGIAALHDVATSALQVQGSAVPGRSAARALRAAPASGRGGLDAAPEAEEDDDDEDGLVLGGGPVSGIRLRTVEGVVSVRADVGGRAVEFERLVGEDEVAAGEEDALADLGGYAQGGRSGFAAGQLGPAADGGSEDGAPGARHRRGMTRASTGAPRPGHRLVSSGFGAGPSAAGPPPLGRRASSRSAARNRPTRVPAASSIARQRSLPPPAMGPLSEVARAAIETSHETSAPFRPASSTDPDLASAPDWLRPVSLVMTHAFAAGSALWSWSLPSVARSFRRVVLVDWREAGTSDRTGAMPSTRSPRDTELYFADGLRRTLLCLDGLLGGGSGDDLHASYGRESRTPLARLLDTSPGPPGVIDVRYDASALVAAIRRADAAADAPSDPLVAEPDAGTSGGVPLRKGTDACDQGPPGLGRYVLLGHSMGGYMSASYALRAGSAEQQEGRGASRAAAAAAASAEPGGGVTAGEDGVRRRGEAGCCLPCLDGEDSAGAGAGEDPGSTAAGTAFGAGAVAEAEARAAKSLRRWVAESHAAGDDTAVDVGSVGSWEGPPRDDPRDEEDDEDARTSVWRALDGRLSAGGGSASLGGDDDADDYDGSASLGMGASAALAVAGSGPLAKEAPEAGVVASAPALPSPPGCAAPHARSVSESGHGSTADDDASPLEPPSPLASAASPPGRGNVEADIDHAILRPPAPERAFGRRAPALAPEQLVLVSPLGMPLAEADEQQRSAPTRTLLWAAASFLWRNGATPQGAIRLMGPFMPLVARGFVASGVSRWSKAPSWAAAGLDTTMDVADLSSYVMNIAGRAASDEVALRSIVLPGAWPKDSAGKRLVWRLPPSLPVSFFYGAAHDWMGSLYGTRICEALSARWEDEESGRFRPAAADADVSLDEALAVLQLVLAVVEQRAVLTDDETPRHFVSGRASAVTGRAGDDDDDGESDPGSAPGLRSAARSTVAAHTAPFLGAGPRRDDDDALLIVPRVPPPSPPPLPADAALAARVARSALSHHASRASNDVIPHGGHLLQLENPNDFSAKLLRSAAAGARAGFVRTTGRWFATCMASGYTSQPAAAAWAGVVARRGSVPVSGLACMLHAAHLLGDAGADPAEHPS